MYIITYIDWSSILIDALFIYDKPCAPFGWRVNNSGARGGGLKKVKRKKVFSFTFLFSRTNRLSDNDLDTFPPFYSGCLKSETKEIETLFRIIFIFFIPQ